MACFKRRERKKERDVAPTRGQFPCPAFGPHGASLSACGFVWIFSRIFFSFPFFCFFLSVLFSLGFSIQKRAISPALSVWTPSHMRTAAGRSCRQASARQSLGTIYHFGAGGDGGGGDGDQPDVGEDVRVAGIFPPFFLLSGVSNER